MAKRVKGRGQVNLDEVGSNLRGELSADIVVQAGKCSLLAPVGTEAVLGWHKDFVGLEEI